MAKVSSKSVPVVAAVALLAGVFSVASAHAGDVSCRDLVFTGSPSCWTNALSVGTSEKLNVIAQANNAGIAARGYFAIYKGTAIIKQQTFYDEVTYVVGKKNPGVYKGYIYGMFKASGDPGAVRIDLIITR